MINELFILASVLFSSQLVLNYSQELLGINYTSVFPMVQTVSADVSNLSIIGSTTELGQDGTCGNIDQIIAYAKTYMFRIYICGEEMNNNPKSMIIFTGNGSSQKIVIDDKMSIDWWTRSNIFRHGIFTMKLERPSNSYVRDTPKFHVYFAGISLIKEDIQLYLFNEKIVPNYRKAILKSDKKATQRFLEYSPNFHCQLDSESTGVTPKRLIAYEISPSNFLIQATCFPPQYNGLYQYVLYSERPSEQQLKLIPFYTLISPEVDKKTGELSMVSGSPQFFPEDNILRVFHKGIGAGGCGYAEEYKLVEDRFELQEFRKYDCYSSGSRQKFKDPNEFPKIYP